MEGQGPLPPTVEVHVAKRVDEVWPDCPAEIADFKLFPTASSSRPSRPQGNTPRGLRVRQLVHNRGGRATLGGGRETQPVSILGPIPAAPLPTTRSQLPQLLVHHEHAWCPSTRPVDSELRIHR
eukprot:3605418-Rhodomonas_salina.1